MLVEVQQFLSTPHNLAAFKLTWWVVIQFSILYHFWKYEGLFKESK